MKCSVTLSKKGKGVQAAPKAKAGDVGPAIVLLDNQDNTFTVLGTTKGGNQVDISALATFNPAPVSDNTGVLTVDPPVGMTDAFHAVGPVGSANIDFTIVFNDGSIGPFPITLPATVSAGPVSGVTVTLGTPTSH